MTDVQYGPDNGRGCDDSATGTPLHVFRSTERHGFGVAIVRGETRDSALARLRERREHEGEDFEYIGPAEEWLDTIRKSEDGIFSGVYYR